MGVVATFIKREKTRPTEEEGTIAALAARQHLAQQQGLLCVLGVVLGEERPAGPSAVYVADSFDPAGNLEGQMRACIAGEGCQHFLDDSASYEVHFMAVLTGVPPERTGVALVFRREATAAGAAPEGVAACLRRGERWEQLGRWGDAMHCYLVELDIHPGHPELLFRLGRARLRYERLLPGAHECLKMAGDACPGRADYVAALGACYRRLAHTTEVRVEGADPARLLRLALTQFERAAALAPGDPEVTDALHQLRGELALDEEEEFFTTDPRGPAPRCPEGGGS